MLVIKHFWLPLIFIDWVKNILCPTVESRNILEWNYDRNVTKKSVIFLITSSVGESYF